MRLGAGVRLFSRLGAWRAGCVGRSAAGVTAWGAPSALPKGTCLPRVFPRSLRPMSPSEPCENLAPDPNGTELPPLIARYSAAPPIAAPPSDPPQAIAALVSSGRRAIFIPNRALPSLPGALPHAVRL